MAQTNDKDLLEQAGDYNLELCKIISYRRDDANGNQYEMDIKPIVQGIDIREDIFSSFITGSVMVYDAQDVRTILPLTGLEKLELKFSTPGMPGYNAVREDGHPFQIYKVDRIKVDTSNPRGQYYMIYFCSVEAYYNGFSRVSQAFSGPIEDGVYDIIRNKAYLNSTKRFIYEPTKTNTKIVVPNIHPLAAIKQLCGYSISKKYESPGYIFYETADGLNFRSIESLLALDGTSPRPSKWQYSYQVQQPAENNPNSSNDNPTILPKNVFQDLKGVIKYEFDKPVDALQHIVEGTFGSQMITNDLFYKKIQTHEFDYLQDYANFFHLENNDKEKSDSNSLLPIVRFEDTTKTLSQQTLSKLMSYTNNSKIHNDYEFTPVKDTIQRIVSQRLSLTQGLKLSLQAYGLSTLRAGDIIDFDLPLMRPIFDGAKQQNNPYYSGRYLITSIRHTVSVEDSKYLMSIQCAKDSVKQPLPSVTRAYKPETKTYNTPEVNIYNDDKRFLTANDGRLLGGV